MNSVRRVVRRVLIGLAAVLLIAVGAVYLLSERQLARTYVAPDEAPLSIPSDSVALATGAHLVRSVGTCTLCHGEDLGGSIYIDGGPLGLITGPNLTSGRGGVGASLTNADWERAIRHGIRRDGTSLIVMPSEVYAHLSDEDLGAIIAYLKTLPPVDRDLEPTHFRFLGRVMLVAGQLPLLVAGKTPQIEHISVAAAEDSVEYGRYLADIGGCHGCHGEGLSGGRVGGPPDLPLASNLTPAGLAGWTRADFIRLMREGVRPTGEAVDEFMPWRVLGRMSDEELHAIWVYLQSVPAKEFGNK